MFDAINKQINEEFYSSYLSLSMSAYFSSLNLNGFANWMYVQSLEETSHAMKLYHYVLDRGGNVILDMIKKPPVTWESALHAFRDAYKHECYISECFNNLVELAMKERDFASNNFFQWFIQEQVEEEANAAEIVQHLEMVGDQKHGLMMLDRELKTRTFTDETAE